MVCSSVTHTENDVISTAKGYKSFSFDPRWNIHCVYGKCCYGKRYIYKPFVSGEYYCLIENNNIHSHSIF